MKSQLLFTEYDLKEWHIKSKSYLIFYAVCPAKPTQVPLLDSFSTAVDDKMAAKLFTSSTNVVLANMTLRFCAPFATDSMQHAEHIARFLQCKVNGVFFRYKMI